MTSITPEEHTAVAEAAAAVATIPTPAERAVVAMSSTKTEEDLKALVTTAKVITEIKNDAGREECHSVLMRLVRARTTITTVADEARADATKFSRAVIAEKDRLIAIPAAEETRLRALRDGWDAKIKAEREAREAAERARIQAHKEGIEKIQQMAILASQCRTSARIQELMDKLSAMTSEPYEEFAPQAQAAIVSARVSVQTTLNAKIAAEEEAARIKAEQEAEAARLAAERAEIERQRLEAEAREKAAAEQRAKEAAEAAAKAEAERAAIEAERQALERQRAELLAQAEALARVKQASEEAKAEAATPELAPVAQEPEPVAPEVAPVTTEPEPAVDLSAGLLFTEIDVPATPEAIAPPEAHELIAAVAQHFGVHPTTAALWLVDRAQEIALETPDF